MAVAAAAIALSHGTTLPGQTTPLQTPAGSRSITPNLTSGEDGRIWLSWIEPRDDAGHELRAAAHDGESWSPVRTIARGDDWFVNWADFPSVIALADGQLAAHWLVKSGADTYAYDVVVARSKDDGRTWSMPTSPHRDRTQTEHGFVSLIAHGDRGLAAAWLDGREMKPGEHGHGHGSMTLRYARIADDGTPSAEAVLDPRVCECCQTSAGLTAAGPIVAYRDRSDDEVRDIHVVRWQQDGWLPPQLVCADGWTIHGCPVNGPALAARDRHVAIAWFTLAAGSARVRLAFSDDSGATFGAPVAVDDGNPVGRAAVLLLEDGSALVAWLERVGDDGALRLRRVTAGGELGESHTIAPMALARRSGFPRLTRRADEIFVAWTADGVRMARLPTPR